MDTKLNDVKDVINDFWEARNKWEYIGSELGMEKHELEGIDDKDKGKCFREMLSIRLLRMPILTRRHICEALKNKTVGMSVLAGDIEMKYGNTGVPAQPRQTPAQPQPPTMPPPGGVVTADGGENFDLVNNDGIAILVSSNYNGKLESTDNDITRMKTLFESFGIQCIPRQNQMATKKNIEDVLKHLYDYLKCYSGSKENKVLIFYFAGHGSSNDVIISDDNQEIGLHGEIEHHFLNHPKLVDIPKLFFVDACRGHHEVLQARLANEPKTPSCLVENCLFAYATIPKHVTYSTEYYGLWTDKLIECISSHPTESLSNILDDVANEVKESRELKATKVVIQPQYVSQLRGRFHFRKP